MARSTEHLSPRQREILGLLAQCVRAREIGSRLDLSENTFRNHISGLLHRLGGHSQLQAVARARERHLLLSAGREHAVELNHAGKLSEATLWEIPVRLAGRRNANAADRLAVGATLAEVS
jgi:DNA-binding CsgD family transcriptional regulator